MNVGEQLPKLIVPSHWTANTPIAQKNADVAKAYALFLKYMSATNISKINIAPQPKPPTTPPWTITSNHSRLLPIWWNTANPIKIKLAPKNLTHGFALTNGKATKIANPIPCKVTQ